jgi:GNAT superfamily N-acetyltransferase
MGRFTLLESTTFCQLLRPHFPLPGSVSRWCEAGDWRLPHRAADVTDHRRVSIRKASAGDSAGILDCLAAAFAPYRDAYTAGAYQDTVLSPDTIGERLSSAAVLVAIDDAGQVVGTVGYTVIGGVEGHLRGMAVRPGWQGRGVAHRLLESVEEETRRLSCARVSLGTTRVLERAMRFYEEHGFRRHGPAGDFFGMALFEYVKELPDGREGEAAE